MSGWFAFYVEGGWFWGDGLVDDRRAGGAMDETVAVLVLVGCHCCWVQLGVGVGIVVLHPRSGGHELAVGSVHNGVHEV